jgi:hypothetical protein
MSIHAFKDEFIPVLSSVRCSESEQKLAFYLISCGSGQKIVDAIREY